MDLGKEKNKKPILDLNLPAEECSSEIGLGFQGSVQLGSCFHENHGLVDGFVGGSSSGGDLTGMEGDPDSEITNSRLKRMRYSVEEGGKGKVYSSSEPNLDLDFNLSLRGLEKGPILEQADNRNTIGEGSSVRNEVQLLNLGHFDHSSFYAEVEEFVKNEEFESQKALLRARRRASRRREQRELARDVAQRFAHLDPEEQKQEKKIQLKEDDEEIDDSQTPFSLAMEAIKNRQSVQKRSLSGLTESLFKWVPANNKGCNILKRYVPSLLDLSLNALAKNADAIVSLEHVPDELRHKLSRLLSDFRKVDAHYMELLARGSPTEIRVTDTSQLTEQDFTKIFGGCNTKELTVLQLDLCGRCMTDYVLHDTLARSSHKFSALVTISLRGAHRLSDAGLMDLVLSAPALQSINLSQCSLLTSCGIRDLLSHFESTLRELYIDDCQNIDAMIILAALKKLKYLEVLSVAGIHSVSDDFVIRMAEVCGLNMKEFNVANCVELTDISLKIIGKNCPNLYALDLSYLHNLTDLGLQHLANGCRSIHRLKLCQNSFSDEAIAAFLEASGWSLNVLSLNNIRGVALNTALSISKCSRNLWSLDLSWCRKLTDEALGLIVDNCLSLKLLKLFGCTQITDMFLDGHSNPMVQIIGCETKAILEQLDILESESPLKYSPPTTFTDDQSLGPPNAGFS